jgi:hypothetical protein
VPPVEEVDDEGGEGRRGQVFGDRGVGGDVLEERSEYGILIVAEPGA